MKTGVFKPVVVLPQRVSGFSPLAYGLSLAYWYDYSQPGSLWADAGRTTPAGDLVGIALQDDLSGKGRTIQQASGAAQPTRDATPTPDVSIYDGGDRLIAVSTYTAVPQPFNVLVYGDNAVNLSMWYDHGSGGNRVLGQRGASSTQVIMNAGASLVVATPDIATPRAILFEYAGASSRVWVYDGGTQAFVQAGSTGNAGTNQLNDARLGGNTANFLSCLAFGETYAWAGALTAADRTNNAGYIRAKWNPA